MNWIALIIAGIFEIGWPLGLKLSQQSENNKWSWIIFSILCMSVSGGFL